MRTRTILLIASLLFLGFAGIAVTNQHSTAAQDSSNGTSLNVTGGKAQGGKGTSYEEPLTTVVFDFDTSGAPLLIRSDDYNGVGQATYTTINGCGNKPCLESEINYLGVWHLNLYQQSVRTLWITPNDAINSSQPPGPTPGYYWQAVEAYSQCYDQSGNIVPFQNLTNGSDNCSLGVVFQPGSIKYKLVMSPHLPAAGPATGLASVACNAVSNGQCINWTITPNTAAANAAVADLYYFNKRGALVFVGQYHNTFRINASNP